MLLFHLDKDALMRIMGDENNYSKVMEKLDRYYGDKRKVVRDCVGEITRFKKVAPRGYRQLIALKMCLEMNFARLK